MSERRPAPADAHGMAPAMPITAITRVSIRPPHLLVSTRPSPHEAAMQEPIGKQRVNNPGEQAVEQLPGHRGDEQRRRTGLPAPRSGQTPPAQALRIEAVEELRQSTLMNTQQAPPLVHASRVVATQSALSAPTR